ncbi:Gfo/Idh/MocA family oxidoreductase [Nonomuraea sp. NPDC048901]|uniref:Gfo/Idh/MocA family protein n=1 Tax=Nonomuraea sp. NPDC048901 TaxID=3155627 RepID=UPI0033DBBC74
MATWTAGVVGTGVWARAAHIPMLIRTSGVSLIGVWSRNLRAAHSLAKTYGIRAFSSYEELLAACDLVAYVVPPSAQPGLALRAARLGKALILEKPLAASQAEASSLCSAVKRADCSTMMMLMFRFLPQLRELSQAHREISPVSVSVRLRFPPPSGWRSSLSPWLEAGAHVIHIAEQLLGPVVAVDHEQKDQHSIRVSLHHVSTAVSRGELVSTASPSLPNSHGAVVTCDSSGRTRSAGLYFEDFDSALQAMADHLRRVLRGESHDLDAEYGLHLQRFL